MGEYDCFDVQTYLKDSSIISAGRGRYLQEGMLEGEILRTSKVFFEQPDEKEKNYVIALKNISEIETYLDFYNVPNRPNNLEQINNFACTPFNVIPYVDTSYVYWWQPVCYFNHGSGSKSNVYIELAEKDGEYYFLMKALRDIKNGEELFIDYRNFKIPQWFKEFGIKNNLTPTEDLGVVQSGVQIDDIYTKQTYSEQHIEYKNFIDNFYHKHEEEGNDFSISNFMSHLPINGSVIDMGCCTGWHSYKFYKAGFNVTAMDISEKYIENLDSKINPRVGGFEQLHDEEEFDGFIMSWLLHHLHRDGLSDALIKTHNALKKNGWLYISTVLSDQDYRDSVGRLYVTFDENQLKVLLERHGFDVKYTEQHKLTHYEDTPMIGVVIHAQKINNSSFF